MRSALLRLLSVLALWFLLPAGISARPKLFPICSSSLPATAACASLPFPSRIVQYEYTEEARAAELEGTLVLSLVIDKNGEPHDLRVVQPLGKGLDERALLTTKRWRFTPGTYKDRPVSVAATMEVTFRHCRAYGVSAVLPATGADFSVSEQIKGFRGIAKRLRPCGIDRNLLRKGACAPMAVDTPLPQISGDLEQAQPEGNVRFSFSIADDGTITNLRVVESAGKSLDDAAIAAAQHWRFRPALYKGRIIPASGTAELKFGICRSPVVLPLLSQSD